MKIRVNKNQQQINFKTQVWTIIKIAKEKANSGYNRFSYPIPRNQGVCTYSLIAEVEKQTEKSVYGGPRCIKNGVIDFSISG